MTWSLPTLSRDTPRAVGVLLWVLDSEVLQRL